MIHWTTAGVVSTPMTVQIRVSFRSAQSFKVGANTSEHTISPLDFHRNLQYFRVGLDTPRSTPCHSLTLSGLPDDPSEYLSILRQVAQFQYCTVHLPATNIPWEILKDSRDLLNRLVLPLTPISENSIPNWAQPITQCVLVLTQENLCDRTWIHRQLSNSVLRSMRFTLSYPAPLSQQQPPTPTQLQHLLHEWEKLLTEREHPLLIRGIPPCLLQDTPISLTQISSRTSNRWYVDAEHQCESARLFFPELLQFHKDDQCRFCRFSTHCDGFYLDYLEKMNIQLNSIPSIELSQS